MANRPYKQFYVATSGTLLASGTTTDLAVGQLGTFDTKNWQANTAPTFPVVQSIVIAQGTPDLNLAEGEMQSDVTFKSNAIFGKNVTGWKVKKAQKPQQRIITVGFDGIDTSKTLTAKPGEVKTVFLTLTGQPISRFYSDDQKGLTVPLTVGTPCVSDCTDDCAGDTVSAVDLADGLIKSFNDYKVYGNQKLSDYVKIEKLVSCETPSGLVTTSYTKWTLTIADTGNLTSLGIVQAQYPGLKVTKLSRTGTLTTYEIIDLTTEGTPDAFENDAITVVPNCLSCPTGYTLVDEYNVFSITRAGNIAASTIVTDYASVIVSGSALKLSFTNGQTVVQIYSEDDLATVDAVVATDVVQAMGIAQNVCTLDTPGTTTAWTEGEVCTKARKSWQVTLNNPACNASGNILTDLQAYYTGIGTVSLVSSSADFCVSTYRIDVLSDNTNCPDCDSPSYTWIAPQPYIQGSPWVAVTENGSGTDCVAGIKLTSAFYMPERNECTFEGIPYYSDPLYITASTFDPEQDGSCAPSPTDWPVSVLQEIKFPAGYGNFIAALEKLDKYYKNVFYNADPVVRKYRGYEWNTDFQGYYDEYILEYFVTIGGTFGTQVRTEYFEDHYYIPQTEGNAFENAINSFLSSGTIAIPLQHI